MINSKKNSAEDDAISVETSKPKNLKLVSFLEIVRTSA